MLEKGVVDSLGIAAFKGKILDIIDMEKGHTEARIFIDRITKIISHFMMKKGFSISVDNLDLQPETRKGIDEAMKKQFKEVDRLIDEYNKGFIYVSPGRTPEETLEDLIKAELWKIMNMTQKIIDKSVDDNNPQ